MLIATQSNLLIMYVNEHFVDPCRPNTNSQQNADSMLTLSN